MKHLCILWTLFVLSDTVELMGETPGFNAVWQASSGTSPNQVCPAWIPSFDPSFVVALEGDTLLMSSDNPVVYGQYYQYEPVLAPPDTFRFEVCLRYLSGTIVDSRVTGCGIMLRLGPGLSVVMFIKNDAVFFWNSFYNPGTPITLDTDDAYHTYTINITSSGNVDLLYDGAFVLNGSAFLHAPWGSSKSVALGDVTQNAAATSKWLSIKHNGCILPADPDSDGVASWCEQGGDLHSTADPLLIVSPAGTLEFTATLKDSLGSPLVGSRQCWLDLSYANSLLLCPDQQRIIQAPYESDEMGVVHFNIRAGHCSPESVRVVGPYGEISRIAIKSLDRNGGLSVTAADFLGDVCNDYDNNGAVNSADWDFFELFLGEDCVTDPSDFVQLAIELSPEPAFTSVGDTVSVCARMRNLLYEPLIINEVVLKTAGYGIALPWTEFAAASGGAISGQGVLTVCNDMVMTASHQCFQAIVDVSTPLDASPSHVDGVLIPLGSGSKKVQKNHDAQCPKSIVGDSDGDGVPDTEDDCPGTKCGCPVDPFGCSNGFLLGGGLGCPVQNPTKPTENDPISGRAIFRDNETSSVAIIPIGVESGDSLLLHIVSFIPEEWTVGISDSAWVYPPDTLYVEITRSPELTLSDSARVIIYAYDGLGQFAGNSDVLVTLHFLCGDADGSGIITISDAVYLIGYIFGGGPAPNPVLAGDADCNGIVTISDAVYLINYIFAGGPAPCAACP